MVCFFTLSKYKESFGFFMFSISLEMHYSAKIWSFIFTVLMVLILPENGAIHVKLANF